MPVSALYGTAETPLAVALTGEFAIAVLYQAQPLVIVSQLGGYREAFECQVSAESNLKRPVTS